MARDNEPGMAKPRKGTSGSGKWTKYDAKKPVTVIDWDEVNVSGISKTVQVVCRDGDAVLFGKSYDGGVLVLTICSGTDRRKFYGKSVAEMESHMHDIIALYES